MSEANKKQVAGDHYASTKIPQHWDIVHHMGWDYFVANATKYLWRMGKKHPGLRGQLQDLDKAIHYLQKKRELLVAEIQSVDKEAAAIGVMGVVIGRKKPLTIADILDEIMKEEEAKGGPTSGYTNQDR